MAALTLGIWLYLIFFRGRFWNIDDLQRRPTPTVQTARVAVVIPARNEEPVLGAALSSLAAQDFDGELRVIVVDDDSSDGTSGIAEEHGVRVIRAEPLPRGWTGKLWAVAQGVHAASALEPDYLLLTDADIVHGTTSVRDLLAQDVSLASVMVKLNCQTAAERLLMPAFVFFFFKLYPPRFINDPAAKTAGAAGGCILIRPEALAAIGGIEAIRGELIDDCALARAVKRHGPISLRMSSETRSIRADQGFGDIWNMIARTAFTQLRHSPLLLAGATLGMLVTYAAPPVLALGGSWLGAGTWMMMSFTYMPMLRFYNQPRVLALALPLIALFYLGATWHSAIRYWRGAGGQWKGRVQDRAQ